MPLRVSKAKPIHEVKPFPRRVVVGWTAVCDECRAPFKSKLRARFCSSAHRSKFHNRKYAAKKRRR